MKVCIKEELYENKKYRKKSIKGIHLYTACIYGYNFDFSNNMGYYVGI